MRHVPRRLAAGPVLALALVTGCGGSGTTSADPSASAQADTLQPVAAVQAAAEATREAGSARIELTSETKVGTETVSITGAGAFDGATQSGTFDLEIPQAGGTISQRIVDGTIYLALPQEPGIFYSLRLEDLAGTPLGGSADPTAGFEALKAASEDVREVGSETVRGEQTTHYAGTFRVDDAIAQASGVQKSVIASTLGGLGLESVPFDVFLDAEGRVRRFVQTLDVPASQQTGGQPLRSVATVEVFDFGTTVDVEPPPADQVKDGAPLLQALTGGGAAAPAPDPTSTPTG